MPPPPAGTASQGADAVLGLGALYSETPASVEEYTIEHKTRGEKSRPHRRSHVREDLAFGAESRRDQLQRRVTLSCSYKRPAASPTGNLGAGRQL